MITPLKSNSNISDDPFIAHLQLIESRALTGIRQAAELGMRVLQGGFPRLRCVMPQNSAVRAKILTCVLHLCNLRTRAMEINQIRTVFDPNYVPNIFNTKTAFRISQFYDPIL